jgi:hypothetical protein
MGAYPNDRSNDAKAQITYGFDYNFFANVTPGGTGGVFAADCDVVINLLVPTYTVIFWLPPATQTGTGTLQYSFSGTKVHGTLDGSGNSAPQTLTFTNRVISKIWFSATNGSSPIVRVEAWGIR